MAQVTSQKSARSTEREFLIVVSPEELLRAETEAFAALRRKLVLPGFRKGNVPEDVARTKIPKEQVFAEAVEYAVQEHGSAALRNFFEDIVGEPKVEIRKAVAGNPLEFRISVEVLPQVPLERWRELRVPLSPKEVSDEDVRATLQELRRERAKYRAVLRPAALGDFVEVDFTLRVEGKDVPDGSAKRFPATLGEGKFLPGFEEAIVGLTAGEEKTVVLPFPAGWSKRELAGKEGEFQLKIVTVHERLLPEEDDAFAKELGNFADLEALRSSIRDGLTEERLAAERRRVRTEAVDRLGERMADSDIPDVLVAQEVERMRAELQQSVEQHGMAFDEYLERLGKSPDEFAKDWREGALRRVKAALVLRALARIENVEAPEAEVEERVQDTLRRYRNTKEAKANLDARELRTYTENIVRNEKVLELIESVVTSK